MIEHSNLYLALGGLLIIALTLAAITRRYQEIMAERRMRIKRVLRGVDLLQDLLGRLPGCPLPADLERVLRNDIISRYQKVRMIDVKYMDIDEMIAKAESKANQGVASLQIEIQSKTQLGRITQSLGEIIGSLQNGLLMTPLPVEAAERYTEQVRVLRSECVYRYHMETAKSLQEEDKIHDALGHCNSIKSFLNEHGPSNDQVKEWYEEAEALRKSLSESQASSTPAT